MGRNAAPPTLSAAKLKYWGRFAPIAVSPAPRPGRTGIALTPSRRPTCGSGQVREGGNAIYGTDCASDRRLAQCPKPISACTWLMIRPSLKVITRSNRDSAL